MHRRTRKKLEVMPELVFNFFGDLMALFNRQTRGN
jgi:hypothetical protein